MLSRLRKLKIKLGYASLTAATLLLVLSSNRIKQKEK